ncbi:MAG: biotin--[acetyl-CoA-carboxylase] ligase [Acinetobacter sp.]|uniref:biotin--[acetyl-CoA-carboxylase] ligase n=1 Tax=Acinetobacter sp. TaxID=472 RepID=UPI000F9F5D13|nr:biotin--[acetyl-CoA-carboxylase] ligase [Acinetobacter sp.]RUP42040.1 MAG: biotin--[acetyl-CoA-carboxylase] ligase [Acinetobacter sp.]
MRLDWLKKYNLLNFETVDSTNSEALRLAKIGTIDNCVITAVQQTGGRGSKGRNWVSILGNLHISILLNISRSLDIQRHSELSFLAANVIYKSIKEISNKQNIKTKIELKWPNDVLIHEKKVAGILVESISFEKKNYVVIGMGVNLIEAPANTAYPTTSLFDEGMMLQNTDEFLYILMNKFDRLYNQWLSDDNFTKVRSQWMKHAYNLNKVITINDGSKRISGLFKEIDSVGAMILQLNNGQLCRFLSGDVINYQQE